MSTPKILLCEGQDGAFIPQTAYCRQQDKVWFAYGKPSTLGESMQSLTVVESIDQLDLVERTLPGGQKTKLPKDGVWVVEGPAQRSDERNANNRYYPRAIWEKWIKDPKSPAQVAIRERAMLGHLEHPKDGRTDGNEGALVVTGAALEEDGTVTGRFELLDTPKGLILQEYTRKGVKWGVSSRGNGSVDEKGRVSPDDYVLETWDAVMRPSVTGAHPRLKTEADTTPPARDPVSEANDASPKPHLPESVRTGVEAVESLCDLAIDTMSTEDRQDLREQIVEAVKQLRNAPANTRVQNALSRAFWKCSAIDEARDESLDGLIESACRDATRGTGHGADSDYAEALGDALGRATRSAEEAEDLRAKLEEAESLVVQLRWRANELSEQLVKADRRARESSRRVELAEALLVETPAREVSGQVQAAVADAIAQVPGLSRHEHLLSSCPSAEVVYALAEALLPTAVPRPAPLVEEQIEETPVNSRPILPRGAVRSEADMVLEESRSTVKASRSVRLAAAAIAGSRG